MFGLAIVLVVLALAGSIYQGISTSADKRKYPASGSLAKIQRHQFHYHSRGEGSPVVVMEAGLGGTSLDWALVESEVSKTTRVFTYDRAGYGWSDSAENPRTGAQIIQELHLLLENTGTKGPYVMVGHSVGALYVRLFAKRYPEEVAGLVLVDPAHENVLQESKGRKGFKIYRSVLSAVRFVAPLGILRLSGLHVALNTYPAEIRPMADAVGFRSQTYRTAYNELIHAEALWDQVRAGRQASPFPDIPLLVVTQGFPLAQPPEDFPEVEMINRLHGDLVALSSNGEHIRAENSGHHVQLDQPEIVIQAVAGIVHAARELTEVSSGHQAPAGKN